MTVADLVDRVIQSTNYLDKFYIIGLLNDALNELVDGARLESSVTVNVVSGTSSYPLPEDFKAPISLIEGDVSSPDIIHPLINIAEQRFGYSIFGDEIILKPEPAKDFEVTFYYYKYATPLVEDTDVPEIDPQWHSLLSTYAIGVIHMIPERNVDKGTIDRYMNQWENGKTQFLRSMSRKHRRSRVREVNVW